MRGLFLNKENEMKSAVVSARDLFSLKRWDPRHVIECVERGGDIREADKFICATRNGKETGIRDLIDKAKELI